MDLLMLDINVFSDDDNDEEVEVMRRPRRPYLLRDRVNHLERWDEIDFFTRFRLKKVTFMILFNKIEDRLLIHWNQSRALSPKNQLLLTLRYYAIGSFLRVCGDFAGVCISTASRVIQKVSMIIASLRPETITMPRTAQEIREVQQGFYAMHRFPRVIGCIDCTHVKIRSPGGDNAEAFRNRKGYFSLNVQVVCDHNMKVRDIVARWPGSSHDSTILAHSNLQARLEEHQFQNGLLLGDGGYAVKDYLLTPLSNPIDEDEMRYNEIHILTRNIIERHFGVWKRRFPVLSIGMNLKLESVQAVILATAVLQNMCRDQNEDEPPELVEVPNTDNEPNEGNNPNMRRDNAVRREIIEFLSRL